MAENKLTGGMKLTLIQNQMKAPKTQYNSFSKFYYRTTDEIQYFLKPLCTKYHTQVVPTSECVWVGPDARGALFQKASVSMLDADTGELIAESTAMAREDDDKKGMSAPQMSASAAQFAVKRALEQLLMLDGSAPEVDAMRPTDMPQQVPQRPVPQPRQVQQPRTPRQVPQQPRPIQPQNAPQTTQKAQQVQTPRTVTNAPQTDLQTAQKQVRTAGRTVQQPGQVKPHPVETEHFTQRPEIYDSDDIPVQSNGLPGRLL